MVAKDNFTLNQIVNSDTIKEYFLMKGWDLSSSATSLSNLIINYSNEKKLEIIKDLEGKKISIQLDEWTNRSKKRFMSVVVTSTSLVHNLGVKEIHGAATAETLLSSLNDVLNEYEIENRNVFGCTSDGASTLVKLQKVFGKTMQLCYAHAIHLSVMDFLVKKEKVNLKDIFQNSTEASDDESSDDEINYPFLKEQFRLVIHKMSKIINSFSHSGMLNDSLTQYQLQDNVPVNGLIKFIKTRWNSMFCAIERVLKIYPQLQKTIIDHNAKKDVVVLLIKTIF